MTVTADTVVGTLGKGHAHCPFTSLHTSKPLNHIFILTCDRVGSGQILLDTISTSAIEGNRPIELGATVKNQEHIVEFIYD